ncbi:hypothetical protein [Natronorubrum sp. FCH18a]|uniref:hypothetical protein n=1 Tax=Natronorubrum sp. FCH18a TaxID=3447018 RepID=UPI003F519B35
MTSRLKTLRPLERESASASSTLGSLAAPTTVCPVDALTFSSDDLVGVFDELSDADSERSLLEQYFETDPTAETRSIRSTGQPGGQFGHADSLELLPLSAGP